MTDPRLVAALAAALDEAWVTEDGGDSEQFAATILPAFLADPRTHEWLEERLVVEGYPEGWILRAPEGWILRAFAAAILEGYDHD